MSRGMRLANFSFYLRGASLASDLRKPDHSSLTSPSLPRTHTLNSSVECSCANPSVILHSLHSAASPELLQALDGLREQEPVAHQQSPLYSPVPFIPSSVIPPQREAADSTSSDSVVTSCAEEVGESDGDLD